MREMEEKKMNRDFEKLKAQVEDLMQRLGHIHENPELLAETLGTLEEIARLRGEVEKRMADRSEQN